MIELKEYTLDEFKKICGITRRAWDTRKNEVLEYWEQFFNYDIYCKVGPTKYIIIKEQYAEYEPLPRKTEKAKIQAYYESCTEKIVKEKPLNTAACIARNIIHDKKQLKTHKEGTVAGYVRPIVKEKYYSPFQSMVWCRLSDNKLEYIPLDEEQLEFLYGLFKANSRDGILEKQIELHEKYKAGVITKAELGQALMDNVEQAYTDLVNEFAGRYGFRPMKVPVLEEKAF